MKPTPKERILEVMKYYYKRGVNKEKINDIYRKILKINNNY
jgi:hypothetical protein